MKRNLFFLSAAAALLLGVLLLRAEDPVIVEVPSLVSSLSSYVTLTGAETITGRKKLQNTVGTINAFGTTGGTLTCSWATNTATVTANAHTKYDWSGSAPTSGDDAWRKLIFTQNGTGGFLLTNGTTQIPVDLAASAVTVVSFNTTDGGSTVRVYSQSLSGSALHSMIEGAVSTIARDSDYSVIYGYGNSIDTNSPYSGILGYGNVMSHHSLGSFLISSGGVMTGTNGIRLGYAVVVTNNYATAIGPNSRTTAEKQIKIGSEDGLAPVVIPGTLTVGGVAITGGSQTPWSSDINGAGWSLTNVYNVPLILERNAYELGVSNSTVETTFYSYTIPGNILSTNRCVEFTLSLKCNNH